MNAGAPKVFISYRREETAGHAGRLYDAIAARFGEHNVFMDVELAPGLDFVEQITEAVGACDALLVVIGPRWAAASDGGSNSRLADPKDFVRLEVETALRRPDLRVIPLLVAGARMPDPDDLPESVRALSRRNALELSDLRWRDDVRRLVSALEEQLGGPHGRLAAPTGAPPVATRISRRRWLLVGAAAVVAAVAVVLALELSGGGKKGAGGSGAALIPAGHRLVARRSLAARHSLHYTVALSVPMGSAQTPLTVSLLAARGNEPLRLVERKPLPDRYPFRKGSYVNDFRLGSNADGSGNVGVSWFVEPGASKAQVVCSLDVSLDGISYNSCV